jgi:hypothetical protein
MRIEISEELGALSHAHRFNDRREAGKQPTSKKEHPSFFDTASLPLSYDILLMTKDA